MSQAQNRQLMHTLQNGGRTNLLEWVKQIVDDVCEEQAIDEGDSFYSIKNHFHDHFLCTISTLLFKFLIDKVIAHIVKPRPPLVKPHSNNDRKRISQ